jgi:hypothetical protein
MSNDEWARQRKDNHVSLATTLLKLSPTQPASFAWTLSIVFVATPRHHAYHAIFFFHHDSNVQSY